MAAGTLVPTGNIPLTYMYCKLAVDNLWHLRGGFGASHRHPQRGFRNSEQAAVLHFSLQLLQVGSSLNYGSLVGSLSVRRVPYYIGDLKKDLNLENYRCPLQCL